MFKRLNEIFLKRIKKEGFSSPDSVPHGLWSLFYSMQCSPRSQRTEFMYLNVFTVIKTTVKCLGGNILDEYYCNNKMSS